MSDLIIETTGLTKRFKNLTAVDSLNLQVPKGALYGFLGPNGAGKSTTIRLLLGLMKPTKGKVFIFKKELGEERLDILRKVGSLVESPSYYEQLTAYENLEITRKILQLDKKEIDKALEIVKLEKWKNTRVKNFSLGMKQRLGLAQALMGDRELLILDEPTNGLDPAGVKEIRNLIKSLPRLTGATVLLSSHILSEIELIADYVGIINKGKLVFQGSLEELKEKSTREICIEVHPLSEAEAFLKRQGYQVENKNGMLYLSKRKTAAAEVNKTLVLEGFQVSHLAENEKTLEEIFLELTGGTLQ